MNQHLIATAIKNITDILNLSVQYQPATQRALVVYDTNNGLTNIVTAAYRDALPGATFINFDVVNKSEIMAAFDKMCAHDLVVLIQSSNFRLDDFRIRIGLFARKIKVIEHMHLYRNDQDVWDVYVNSLAYDASWYRGVGYGLKNKLVTARELKIKSYNSELVVAGGLEVPKLNIGDYTDMENVGGTFPIGEVFTEAKDFEKVNGTICVYAFANRDFTISMHEPFRVEIQNGLIVGFDETAPNDFRVVLDSVKQTERPLIREIGFGLNRAITKERYLGDITAFERILGMHFSLGEKHSVYKKAGIRTGKSRFHVDLFPTVDSVSVDGEVIFREGQYLLTENLDHTMTK